MTDVINDQGTPVVVVEKESSVFTTQKAKEVAVRVVDTTAVEIERREQIVVEQDRSEVHIVAVGAQGPVGPQGPPGAGNEAVNAQYIAAEALGGHRVIVTNEDGEAVYADNTNEDHATMATKITTGAAILGDEVQAQLVGQMTELSWNWTPRASLYVGSNGMLTETPPSSPAVFSKVVAVAETATRILIVQEPPIMLA